MLGQSKPGLVAGGATEVVGADDDRNAADPGAGGADDTRGTTEGGSEFMVSPGARPGSGRAPWFRLRPGGPRLQGGSLQIPKICCPIAIVDGSA